MKLWSSVASSYSRYRFSVLFVVLFLAIAGHGLVGLVWPLANPLEWLLGLSLVAVVFSAPRGWLRWLLGGLATGGVAVRLMERLLDRSAPLLLSELMVAAVCVLAAGVALRRALGSGPVDAERICAALDVYLLVGIAFGAGYWLIESTLPGSFSFGSSEGFTPPRAVYFSFVVQATLGFGDIFPLRDGAQGLVIAQGIGGQMYLVVLIARLVSLYDQQEKA